MAVVGMTQTMHDTWNDVQKQKQLEGKYVCESWHYSDYAKPPHHDDHEIFDYPVARIS